MICQKCHPGFFKLFCYAFTFFIGIATILYAFSFNDSFVKAVFVALDEFDAVSYEPESRSFGHDYRIAIGLGDCN